MPRQDAASEGSPVQIAASPPASIRPYSPLGLWFYDPLIVEALAPRVWGCAPERIVGYYDRHVTANHADLGVATGYFLDRCNFRSPHPRLALIDLQPHCLRYAARRLARYRPETYLRDALTPIVGIPGKRFDSIAIGGVLHCLKGDLPHKARVFDAIAPLARSGTKVFGYTLLREGADSRMARTARALLNWAGVVDNQNDTASDLRAALEARFADVSIELSGCMALFSGVFARGNNKREVGDES
jgi:hypothetical protein